MLQIANNGAEISATNFWDSEYNVRGLAYLSINAGALRLLLPTKIAALHLESDILVGVETSIVPSLFYPGNKDYVDVVFEDGSPTPFSLSLDLSKQVDRKIDTDKALMIVYAGDLSKRYEFICTIDLHDKKTKKEDKSKYINHLTVNTGHSRKSPKSEVAQDTLDMLKPWVRDMLKGYSVSIADENYACKIGKHNAKLCEFIICRIDDKMRQTEIIKAVLCTHSREKKSAWKLAQGQGEPPEVPFLAVKLMLENMKPEYQEDLIWIADFERCIAWAYIDYKK
ncbi:hypothetical protein FHQ26_05505 [Testudinibacter sp. TR-2022]|uniref:hypothetical protein n=1 Tax=Testudinibacter sp. TR-2022 TaxID=2585029 RepID=UPI0011197335|nr:hypothetical protein [Testudinibacter sp. TR-2022]TNH04953.1 hypothetical protein FHQ22_02660 [Pasteurellaceae bacterium Phil31]TNH06734.1 hypothetical protein FHQ25_12080 [Testudinibacter sp. TR-2022]TNH10231.1 hypothetical protein FHQ26_05505 [Testudinibacter sp. TR-2022]